MRSAASKNDYLLSFDDGEKVDEEISIDNDDYTSDKFGNVLWSKKKKLFMHPCPELVELFTTRTLFTSI